VSELDKKRVIMSEVQRNRRRFEKEKKTHVLLVGRVILNGWCLYNVQSWALKLMLVVELAGFSLF